MPTFKDTASREWQVKIDAPKIREVREQLTIDLVGSDGKAFDELAADPVLLVDCLWVLVRGQHPITDVQFGEALGGDSLEAAAQALMAAALDFFRPRQRSLLRCLDEKQTQLRQKAVDLAMAKINDPALEEAYLAKVDQELTTGLSRMLEREAGETAAEAWDWCEWCYQLAGVCGVSPAGLTARELFWMATARQRAERLRLVDLAAMVWHQFGGQLTEWHVTEYIRTGQIPTGDGVPPLPDVERHIAKIAAAGKFVMPDPPTL